MRVILPLSRPALTAVAIFLFLLSWNDFMWPLIVTNTDATRTLPVGLATFVGGGTVGGQSIAYYGLARDRCLGVGRIGERAGGFS